MSGRKLARAVSLIVSASLLGACSGRSGASLPTPGSSRLAVVTTLSLLADMARNVAGNRATVTALIPAGAGPEDYQPKPEDARTASQADVFLYNGHGLEDWLDKLFGVSTRPGQTRVALSQDLPALEVGSAAFGQGNPHFWLNPQYGMTYVERIRDAMTLADPAGKDIYQVNAAAYIARINQVDQQMEALANQVPLAQRKLVVDHDAWIYFAQRYNFTVVGSILGNPEKEPSAGELANLVRQIRSQQVKAVFSEAQFNPRLADSLAAEAGVKTVSNLYTDALDDKVGTYLDMLLYDMKTISEALK